MRVLIVFLAACVCGTVIHFLYEPLGRPKLLAPFLPVSESPWEHYKMAFWPLCAAMAVLGIPIDASAGTILYACLLAALHSLFAMFGLFYLYFDGLDVGHSLLAADILSYYLVMGAGYLIGLRALLRPCSPVTAGIAAFALGLLVCAIVRFTFAPPPYSLFTPGGRRRR